MKISVSIAVDKSFEDEITVFKKAYEDGDISQFMKLEADYLERLVKITKQHGETGNSFQVCYSVLVEVE